METPILPTVTLDFADATSNILDFSHAKTSKNKPTELVFDANSFFDPKMVKNIQEENG